MVTCGKLTLNPASEDNMVEEKDNMVEENDNMMEEKDNMVEEKDNMMEENDNTVEENDNNVTVAEDMVEEVGDKMVEEKMEAKSHQSTAEGIDVVDIQNAAEVVTDQQAVIEEASFSVTETKPEEIKCGEDGGEAVQNSSEGLFSDNCDESQVVEKEVMDTVGTEKELEKDESYKTTSDHDIARARVDESIQANVQNEAEIETSESESVPLVDIVVVERINNGGNALDMVSKMIDLEEESQNVSPDDVTNDTEEDEEVAVDPKYVIKSIEKLADEDFEAVFEANFGEDEASLGLSEEDIKALEKMNVKVDLVETSDDSNQSDFKSSVIKFQDAIENYTKTAVVVDNEKETKQLKLDVAQAQDLQTPIEKGENTFEKGENTIEKTEKGENTFEKTEVLEQMAEEIAQDIMTNVKEEAKSMNEGATAVKANTEQEIANLEESMEEVSSSKKEATRQIEPEVVVIQTEPETALERQLVVEEPCVQENHYLTTSKDEEKEDFSDDVQILRKSEVAELLDFPKPKPLAAQGEQEETLTKEQAPPEKVEGSSAMADAGLLVENPDKAGSVVENDFTDRVKHAESEVSRRGSFAEDDEEVKVNGHVQDEKENQPTKKEIVTQVNRADEQRPSAAESKSEKADVQDVKKEQPTKKESVAECLRRYREEEAKARRAAQMRKNYTLIDDEPEICQEVSFQVGAVE